MYHNLWYTEPGHYYYFFKGSGVFLNVGKTLITPNKVAALKALGYSDTAIIKIGKSFTLRHGKNNILYPLPRFIKKYSDRMHVSIPQARHDIIKSCIANDNYYNNRIANNFTYDQTLWDAGKKAGYDTIQFTEQPNGDNGWGFEILDLRNKKNNSLIEQWKNSAHDFSIRNPVDMTISAPCHYHVPFKALYCQHPKAKI